MRIRVDINFIELVYAKNHSSFITLNKDGGSSIV
jgi:hypothetical protein